MEQIEEIHLREVNNLQKTNKKYLKRIIYVLLFLILIVGIIIGNNYRGFVTHKIKLREDIKIQLEAGNTIKTVSNKLCDMQIVKNCFFLNIFIHLNAKKYNDIKKGKHIIKHGLYTIGELLDQFKKSPPKEMTKSTVFEGENVYDISGKIKGENNEIKKKLEKLVVDKEYISKLKKKFSFLKEFGDISSLEGFLYPDTYYFNISDMDSINFPELLIKTQLKNFEKKVWSKYSGDILNNKLTPYQIIILASFIEKEAKYSKNKPDIADVLLKRWEKNMPFQVDISLCYGLSIAYSECTQDIIEKNIFDGNNIYNTRVHKGFTPTPIGNPSVNSIKAILYPHSNNWYYYLHDKQGNIHFATGYEEHQKNRRKYLGK